MTENQLRYLQYQEGVRHNLATEEDVDVVNAERERSNRANEAETFRSNVAKETETHRSNRAKEDDTDMQLALKTIDTVTGAIKNVADPVLKALSIFGA